MYKTGNLVSMKIIADRLMRNPVLKDLTWEFIVDNSVEVMRILEAPSLFTDKHEVLEVKNFRAMKPVDLTKITGVSRIENKCEFPLSLGGDAMHDDYGVMISPLQTYTLNSRYILPRFENGLIKVYYKSIATDEDCYPLILDNAVLLRCIESYVKWKWFDILNDMDMISDKKLNKAESDYCFNVAQADSNLKLPSDEEMELLVIQVNNILPNKSKYGNRLRHLTESTQHLNNVTLGGEFGLNSRVSNLETNTVITKNKNW